MRCYVTPSCPVLCDDQLSEGWYRFVGAERTNTLKNHLARFGYGTRYSGWLDGAYPSVEDDEVAKTICFTFPPRSCKDTKIIFVKSYGSYYIHKLFKPSGRDMRYCGTL